ncbi:MAG: C1 family peptidase [Candidatus Thermoplasmatota archaeon]|nr:C1 family peptidase [Candidatus Thermoplasmatota archaeon]
MYRKFLAAALFLALLLPLVSSEIADSEGDLRNYLSEEQYRHMELLGYRTVEQFTALAHTNPDALCYELGIDYGEMDTILSRMPETRYFEPVYPEEQPMGLLLEEEPRIVTYEELLYQQPEYVGMSTTNLIPYLNPIRDQGQRGTCASFSGTAFLESELSERDLSEQYFFYACKQRDGSPYSDGTTMTAVRDAIKYDGACYEETWPYNPYPTDDPAQGPAPAGAAAEAKNFVYPNVQYWGYFFSPSIEALKSKLDNGHMISFGVPVYDSWYSSPETKRTGVITMPLSNDQTVGGHAMDIVGYVDNANYAGGGYFLIRNSWGTDWAYESVTGYPGYGIMPYAYITNYWQGGLSAA